MNGPTPTDGLAGVARDVLLDHLARGDARQALRMLLSALSAELGAPCALQAGTGPPRWTMGDTAGLVPLGLERLGERVGTLFVPAGRPAPAALLPTAAALLASDAEAGTAAERAGHVALMQAALEGAGTYVWQWDIDSDWLADIDEGLRPPGYASHAIGHTQEDWNRLIHPDDRAAYHEAYLRHARGEVDTYESTYRMLAADGSWRWTQERGRIVERHPDGRPRRMLGTQADVTQRVAIEMAASEAQARLSRIADHVPGILFQFRVQPGGRAHFPYVSERSRALFGVDPDELVRDAAALLRRVDFTDRQAMLDSIDASRRGLSPWHLDFRLHRRDGADRWMRGDASPLRDADGSTVWHGYIEDVTERRELERARQQAEVAAAANRTKTEFLSRMSHELRTPLNAVLGFAQLMEIDEFEPPGEGQRRRLKLIVEAGQHLLRMIGDLLDLTRIESGRMALHLEAVDLGTVAAEAAEMLRSAADQAQVALAVHAAAPVAVHADRTRLRQVLLNLIGNAIKYNRPGGRVDVFVRMGDDGHGLCEVRDTGIGIAEASLPRLFEPFYRVQPRGAIEGAGIGLSVTQALLAMMSGRIAVASREGEGSAFTIALPAASQSASLPA